MSASDLTAAELDRRTANVRPYAGARRGVAEAIDEAHRQFGFRDHGDARYWLDEAEAAAGVISPQEMNAALSPGRLPCGPCSGAPGRATAAPGPASCTPAMTLRPSRSSGSPPRGTGTPTSSRR